MRILTRRIYRAFPELDRYSDEQCDRFVRAARRAFWPRVGRVAVRVMGILIWLALVAGAIWASGYWNTINDRALTGGDRGFAVIVGVGVVTLLVIPFLGWLAWRDVQLRRRIKRILRARATCPGCGYRLVGLFVNAEHKVICTECGMETEVDPSLSELTIDEVGRKRFNPAPSPPTWWQRKMTPKRKKWIRRGALASLVLVLLGIPAGWAGYELFLRHQAGVAKRERPGVAGMVALIEKRQPPGTSKESPNAMETLEKAISLQTQAQVALWRSGFPKTASGRDAVPDVSYIYGSYEAPSDPDRAEMDGLVRAGGLKSLEAWRKAGVFEELKKMAAQPRAARPIDIPPGEPLFSVAFSNLGASRNLARGCAARMQLAQVKGDRQEYVESFEQLMALSRVTSQQPFLIDQLVSVAIEALGYGRVQNLLVTHPGEEWLSGIEETLVRQAPMAPKSMFEGERLGMLDTTAWLFSEPDNVRWGKYSAKVRALGWTGGGNMLGGRLGTYAENRDAINEAFDALDANAARERPARSRLSDDEHSLSVMQVMMPAVGKALQSQDQVELDRRGVRVQIALERYWLKHGEYPAALSELVPALMAALPSDPWSGQPFGYKRIDPARDEFGRGYLLYSVGGDGKDDGGTPSKNRYDVLHRRYPTPAGRGAAGSDFIINTPSKSPSLEGLPEVPDMSKPLEPSEGVPAESTVE